MFASEFDVEALTFTSTFCPEAPGIGAGKWTFTVNAAANRCRHRTVPAGDSMVTMAAASPDAEIFVTLQWSARVSFVRVAVTPALVPTAEATQLP